MKHSTFVVQGFFVFLSSAIFVLLGTLICYLSVPGEGVEKDSWAVQDLFHAATRLICTVMIYKMVVLWIILYLSCRSWSNPEIEQEPFSISVLIPAHNEEKVIRRTLGTIVQLDYPRYDIIVIDDGSTDRTDLAVYEFLCQHGTVDILKKDSHARFVHLAGTVRGKKFRFYRKRNGGKSSALNLAFNKSEGMLVLTVDADTARIAPSSLWYLMGHFYDPRVGGVAGQVKVNNRFEHLHAMAQALEYALGHGLFKRAQTISGHVLVMPGPLALMRRSALVRVQQKTGNKAGPFSNRTLAEDTEITLLIQLYGYRVYYEPRAWAMVDAEPMLKLIPHERQPCQWEFSLFQQRYRWTRGIWQALTYVLAQIPSRPVGSQPIPLSFSLWLSYMAVEVYCMPTLNTLCIVAVLFLFAVEHINPTILFWLLGFLVFDFGLFLYVLLEEKAEEYRLLSAVFFIRFFYIPYLEVAKWISSIAEIVRMVKKWYQLTRQAIRVG